MPASSYRTRSGAIAAAPNGPGEQDSDHQKLGQEFQHRLRSALHSPVSGNLPTGGNMSDAHDLDALVVRQLLTDGGFREKSLAAYGAHGRHREFFRHPQHVNSVIATALAKVGR